ncbi:hypothetical protein Mth01_57530 [Sphaerimonospora thailandensis]|uniref:Uncharacterized protein n=1 Tax=Sphaerimonospora thailandensis TaxID=795644 RepID=A0A8J3RF01_9ACTN|nr:hypothetical protein Mth01_57530 [Sphaerimonospora thailandensis]
MSGYNLLKAVLMCPRCDRLGSVCAEFRFGLFEFREYEIGDHLEWGVTGDRSPRRRPEEGNLSGEGYVECPFCGRDYWVTIDVRADVITLVNPDPDRPGYIPSGN